MTSLTVLTVQCMLGMRREQPLDLASSGYSTAVC